MTKAEKFIQDYTNHCSNEIENGVYHEWLTPKQARRAVEIARDEMLKEFEKARLKHCDELTEAQAQIESDFVTQHIKENNRMPTFIDAIEYGMQMMKELLMKEAIDGMVSVKTNYNILMCDRLDVVNAIKNFNEGDKVKVIIIKED
jgi:hypothetical protein